MKSGFLLINKDKGMTSYDVIRDLKKYLKLSKKDKIGHTGTLDPMTTGLLVVALGKATKLIPYLNTNNLKAYEVEMKLGSTTDSLDLVEKVIKKDNFKLENDNHQEIENIIKSFIGEYDQLPPLLSAKKIDGKRAYDYFFEGKEVNLKKCRVNIYTIKKIEFNNLNNSITFICEVSKGTYVRSLIRDIAKRIGTIGMMTSLNRLKSDCFDVDQSVTLNQLKLEKENKIYPLEKFLKDNFQNIIKVDNKLLKLVQNGVKFENKEIIKKFDKELNDINNSKVLFVDDNDRIVALYERKKNSEKLYYKQLVQLGVTID